MVRTIYVVFTNKKLSNSELRGMKQYMFLCPYDIIQAGDITVQYAGIVYFKNAEDAKKAAKMLGADIRYLF